MKYELFSKNGYRTNPNALVLRNVLDKIIHNDFRFDEEKEMPVEKVNNTRDSNVVPHRSTKPSPSMLRFADKTGSGAVMLAWSFPFNVMFC